MGLGVDVFVGAVVGLFVAVAVGVMLGVDVDDGDPARDTYTACTVVAATMRKARRPSKKTVL